MTSISCPHCQHDFATARSPGTQVFCPKCLKYFAISAGPGVRAPATTAASSPMLPTAIDLPTSLAPSVGILEGPPPPRRAPVRRVPSQPHVAAKKPRASKFPWILAGVAVGVTTLVLLGMGIVLVTSRVSVQDAPVAVAPIPGMKPPVRQAVEPARPDAPAPRPMDVIPPRRGPAVEVPTRPVVAEQPPPIFEIAPLKKEPMLVKGPAIAGLDQKKIDDAIARGVDYLKKHNVNVALPAAVGRHRLGYAALTGLTLLECKTPADDTDVQKLARSVRTDAADENRTYELALSILFLDRLGDPRDRPLIQIMALRLVAGQNEAGGWTYQNPILTPADSKSLLNFLNQFRRDLPADNMIAAKTDPLNPAMRDLKTLNPLDGSATIPTAIRKDANSPTTGIAGEPASTKPPSGDTKIVAPLDISPKPMALPPAAEAKSMTPALKPKATRVETLPANLQKIPAVSNDFSAKTKAKGKGAKGPFAKGGPGGDNSNTQFAMLGLWAARRHGVGSERALLLADKRFAASQNDDGGWGYHLTMPTRHTMNCVGLMGLAMGHGAGFSANPNLDPKNAKNMPPADPQIQKGLQSLGRFIGTPSADPAETSMENLYLLWSIERVAMLYDLKTIGGKDWYGWGAQMLVHHQRGEGSWTSRQYAGSSPTVDTCFALLFLKRSNLVKDLSQDLRLYIAITDPESSASPR